MRWTGRARIALGAATLACLFPVGAMAQEKAGWHGEASAQGVSLTYGAPQSGHAPVSFSCSPDGHGLTFVFSFILADSADSAEVEVQLQAGGILVPIRTTGMHASDVRSRLYVLQGKTVLDDRLARLLTSDGTLTVFFKGREKEFPLEGARDAAAPLLKGCAGQALEAGPVATVCRMRAWSTGTDADSRAIHAGPGAGHTVIGRLPPPQEIGGESFATEVSVTGSRDGWFRIEEATINNYIVDEGPDAVFHGEGWVPGAFLGLSVEGSALFTEPSRHAPLALDLRENRELRQGPDYLGLRLERLHACMGDWAEVEVTDLGKRVRGWTNDICSSQVTTCP